MTSSHHLPMPSHGNLRGSSQGQLHPVEGEVSVRMMGNNLYRLLANCKRVVFCFNGKVCRPNNRGFITWDSQHTHQTSIQTNLLNTSFLTMLTLSRFMKWVNAKECCTVKLFIFTLERVYCMLACVDILCFCMYIFMKDIIYIYKSLSLSIYKHDDFARVSMVSDRTPLSSMSCSYETTFN